MIKDSGERSIFETGAVRDMHSGKGDMVSLPANAMLRLSKHYEAGALKYGRFNYQKGIPVSSFFDSALRHLFKYLAGYDDEDHMSAAAFNVLGILEIEATHKELIDLPSREGKKVFEYDESRIEKKDSNSKQARKCDGCKHRFLFGDEFPCDECVHRGNGMEDMFVPYDRAEEKE